MVSIVVGRRAAAGAGFASAMLRIRILAPCTSGIAMTAILCCGVPAGAAGCSTAMLTGGRIAPRPITHAVRSVVIIRCTAVSARTGAPMLAGRILLPRAIAITVTAGIDCLTLGLPAGTAVIAVSIAGAGGGLLALQYPCMASTFRASARSIAASPVALSHICSYILDIMTGIALIVCCVSLR